MRSLPAFHVDKTLVTVGLVIAAAVGIASLWVKRFASKAEAWPTITAKIENVFLDSSSRGPNRQPETHAVLAYSYSIGDGYFSGQIRLLAGERSLESLEKGMIGQQISVHYDPESPTTSIYLEDYVKNRPVMKDRRTSVWSWF